MDNAYILLLIIKLGVNVGNFINWYNWHHDGCESHYTYTDYVKEFNSYCAAIGDSKNNHYDLGNFLMSEFEFKYFVSYLFLRGNLR